MSEQERDAQQAEDLRLEDLRKENERLRSEVECHKHNQAYLARPACVARGDCRCTECSRVCWAAEQASPPAASPGAAVKRRREALGWSEGRLADECDLYAHTVMLVEACT